MPARYGGTGMYVLPRVLFDLLTRLFQLAIGCSAGVRPTAPSLDTAVLVRSGEPAFGVCG